MHIKDLKAVTTLYRKLEELQALKEAAERGTIGDLNIYLDGGRHDVWKYVSSEVVRKAVINSCIIQIGELSNHLMYLGVQVRDS